MYNRSQNILQNFCLSSINLIYLTLDIIDRQIWPVLIILKLSYFGKNNFWKTEVSQIFGLWDQEIDSSFTNHKPLIGSFHGRSPNGCHIKNLKSFQIFAMVLIHWDEKILKIWWPYLFSLQSYRDFNVNTCQLR